jgi:hypothetical protein
MSHHPAPHVTAIKEHDYEPTPGLPAPLPEGETILWQGAPDWRSFARRAMRLRWVSFYFAALVVWTIVGGISDGTGLGGIAVSALRLVALGTIACGILTAYAWLVARSTIYTVTTRRVVMRSGIALPLTIQIAFAMIDGAAVRDFGDGTGDVSLTLRPGQRVAYLVAWPHTRPWKFANAEPCFRGIPDVARVAQVLGRALAASASMAPKTVSVQRKERAGQGSPVPAAA